ncbi:MAG: hydantoinase B/oxoprolinase family protein [Gammaproteobacteria bacterium]|nr:hydantoinase B/oxoprolinase family protein [Gammaproteobacteria bacterium]
MTEQWEFWIDRGGTFTDVVARRPGGEVVTHKLLSENPGQYADAAIQGIADILNRHGFDIDLNTGAGVAAGTDNAVAVNNTNTGIDNTVADNNANTGIDNTVADNNANTVVDNNTGADNAVTDNNTVADNNAGIDNNIDTDNNTGIDNAKLPGACIAAVKMGTTVATNALLERRGERTLLVITRGFADALRIGYQSRPALFALNIQLPRMLYEEVLEVDERINAAGEVLQPLDVDAARVGLQRAYQNGCRAAAIVLMHGYRHHAHEAQLAHLARAAGFAQVSVSHIVSPLMKLVSRGDTTVVDAYLSPILRRYVEQVTARMPDLKKHGGRLMFMRSSGGLTDAGFFQGKDAVLSGPAGGVVGMARVSEAAGFGKVIGFDMGGTSTDVSHYNGEFERAFETQVAGVRLRAPMLLIHTVAAGGGSILHFDGARYRVGPDSAGAHPGPACYRNGGPLAITDCNVMLGKLQPDLFPKVFGPNADQALDARLVAQQFAALAARIERETGDGNGDGDAGDSGDGNSNSDGDGDTGNSPEQVAAGFLTIAVENMANAIKKISVQRGYDISEYALCCFGGAGGQHACLVADALAVKRILIHPFAGVLSAYGMGLADSVVERQLAVEAVLDESLCAQLGEQLDELQSDGVDELRAQGIAGDDGQSGDGDGQDGGLTFKRVLHLRYEGSDTALVVRHGDMQTVIDAFEQLHRMRFGFISPEKQLVVESIEVEVSAAAKPSTIMASAGASDNKTTPAPDAMRRCYMDGRWHDCPFYQRARLAAEQWLAGPAVILDPTSTIVVEPGWRARLTADDNLILERHEQRAARVRAGDDSTVDPVMLEIFNNLFMSVAEQMGSVLENTAASVNIKERLDFSCAIFDPRGALVANAPHMPVHLGSMGESIKTVIRERGGTKTAGDDKDNGIQPGDAYILNAPYNGGTHLPDVTIIKPVFADAGQLLFYVASRGHHADIGGKTPGSAPADSTTIEEEGVVIDNFKLVENDRFREKEIHELLTGGKWPARNPRMNIADFKAQLAACEKGARELNALAAHYGIDTVHAYMRHVQDNAEQSVRRVLGVLRDGQFSYAMDDGARIQVAIRVDQKRQQAVVDFTGTSKQHPGNFNAPAAVVRAAVLYVFRCLVDDDIPLNEGCLKPMRIIIPDNSMINPQYPAAVIAGNVETSQYLVDTLFGALQTVAASQGTMNNFIWGNDALQYYETICGGAGATREAAGASAVHTHMTNTRLTDPEVLEWRFPVLLESFAIRRGSGGAGKHRGGDGAVRRVKFLQDVTANLLSGHRVVRPYGMAGGGPGAAGANRVEHPDGSVTPLPGVAQVELRAGDVFVIETPGGGGYGAAE